MKLSEEPKRKERLPFFSWILFDPRAFNVTFIMSITVGAIVSAALLYLTWAYHWGIEISIIITVIASINLFRALQFFRKIKYSTKTTINDTVFGGKYTPKKVKKEKIIKEEPVHDSNWPKKRGGK